MTFSYFIACLTLFFPFSKMTIHLGGEEMISHRFSATKIELLPQKNLNKTLQI